MLCHEKSDARKKVGKRVILRAFWGAHYCQKNNYFAMDVKRMLPPRRAISVLLHRRAHRG